jgi:hypothetical protein
MAPVVMPRLPVAKQRKRAPLDDRFRGRRAGGVERRSSWWWWGWDLCEWRSATCITCQRRRSWARVADRACPACAFCHGRRRSRRLAGLAGGCRRDPDREPPPSAQPRLAASRWSIPRWWPGLGVFARRIEQQGRSRRCSTASPTGRGLDARRPRPAAQHPRCARRRRSWGSRRIGGSSRSRANASATCPPSCPSSPGTSNTAARVPRRSVVARLHPGSNVRAAARRSSAPR